MSGVVPSVQHRYEVRVVAARVAWHQRDRVKVSWGPPPAAGALPGGVSALCATAATLTLPCVQWRGWWHHVRWDNWQCAQSGMCVCLPAQWHQCRLTPQPAATAC